MPTLKQTIVASRLLENGGNVSLAMREVGYSKAMAKNPQKLTKSKGWRELMENKLSDEVIANRLYDLINSPNGHIAARAVDMVLKAKGKYTERFQVVHDPIDDMTDEELDARIDELEKKLKSNQFPNRKS